jgi:hypothetical protein
MFGRVGVSVGVGVGVDDDDIVRMPMTLEG